METIGTVKIHSTNKTINGIYNIYESGKFSNGAWFKTEQNENGIELTLCQNSFFTDQMGVIINILSIEYKTKKYYFNKRLGSENYTITLLQ